MKNNNSISNNRTFAVQGLVGDDGGILFPTALVATDDVVHGEGKISKRKVGVCNLSDTTAYSSKVKQDRAQKTNRSLLCHDESKCRDIAATGTRDDPSHIHQTAVPTIDVGIDIDEPSQHSSSRSIPPTSTDLTCPFWKGRKNIILGGIVVLAFGAAVTIGVLADSSKEITLYYADRENLLCSNDPLRRYNQSTQKGFETLEQCCRVEFLHLDDNECFKNSMIPPTSTSIYNPSTTSVAAGIAEPQNEPANTTSQTLPKEVSTPSSSTAVSTGKMLCPDFCEAFNCNVSACVHCELYCGATCAYRKRNHDVSVDTSARTASCSAPMFDDVTKQVLRREWWYHYPLLGRPLRPENAPLFVDHNGDGVLDMAQFSHMLLLAESHVDQKGAVVHELVNATNRIYLVGNNSDNHGSNIVDLDGDGVLDLIIAVGGGLGGLLLDDKASDSTDNVLMWGENLLDMTTGKTTTVFRGGKATAKAAGIEMHLARGRFNYVFDANGDGRLDIFFAADRPRTNYLVPGVLMINQGNRTFKKDRLVSEYSKAMILTDVDGDGFANEFVITRDHCYTQDHYAPYPDDIVAFCNTRPVGTTAVYKFNSTAKQMEDIGKHYSAVKPDNSMQPPCCPLGKGDTFYFDQKNCFVVSIASGDFDQDLLADQVFLYTTKIGFYFSSDRPAGVVPFGGQWLGAEIYLPDNCHGKALRVIDFDNDGKEELLVGCFEAGTFLLYSKGAEKDDWTLVNGCNNGTAFGDLSNSTLANISDSDYNDACKSNNSYAQDLCLVYNGDDSPDLVRDNTYIKLEGVTTVDLNSDGFMDLVVAYRNGHHLFLQNRPSETAVNNRFVAFKLDDGYGTYGIGATVLLYADACDGCSVQFREIASHQHWTDKWGYKDDRIFFGLGSRGVPTKVIVRWPNGVVQTEDLQDWAFGGALTASTPVVIKFDRDSVA